MPVLNRELAEKEVNKWLDSKKVRATVRRENKDNIEAIIDGFEDGLLVLNKETNAIKQTLIFPTGAIKEIIIQPRLKVSERIERLKNAGNDADSRVVAVLAALSGNIAEALKGMDADDLAVSRNITAFFF